MIKAGDILPDATLMEYNEREVGPVIVPIPEQTQGRTIAMVGVPGAFTPTCSIQHLPGYLNVIDAFKAAGVEEIWCISVNDAFVMGAWAREQKTVGNIRMLSDGNASFAKATGLTLDLSDKGLGLRSTRYSMLVQDSVVVALNNEGSGKLNISDARTLLKQAQRLQKKT